MNREISLHTIALYNGTEYELENLLNSLLYKIDQLQQELQRKDNNWNELKRYVDKLYEDETYHSMGEVLDKIKELEENK